MEWVQDPGSTIWHLVWQVAGEDPEEGTVGTWCDLTLPWDGPTKALGRTTFEDTLHVEGLR
jgi:hypothetical protein